jgi:2-succinyl-6-hydroxy-2,4-cyclohexadiene-1-carboxylate synthase
LLIRNTAAPGIHAWLTHPYPSLPPIVRSLQRRAPVTDRIRPGSPGLASPPLGVYGPAMRCVLLHGFAGDPASWEDVALATDAERLALPGHLGGGPLALDWDSNLAAIAARIGRCDAVIGYSLGARVALGLVIGGYAPRGVLISVNPGIADHERAARRASDAVWAELARRRGTAAFVDAWQAQPLFATQARAPAERLAVRRTRRLALDPEQLARSLETMGLAEMPDYRARVDDRVALIAGADDAKYVAIARGLPARLELIADSGHDPTLEQPVALARAIDRAIDRTIDRTIRGDRG